MTLKTIFEVAGKDSVSGPLLSATKSVEGFEKAGDSAGQKVSAAFTRLAGPILGAVSAVQGLQKLVDITREFDVLNAGLITATGSAEGAAQAFAALQGFATETPYDIQQVTDGFIKLKNYGLDPSERALTAYGNTASAMGKDLNQMVEAVADAATGEFERLKEFGIKSKKEGDEVQFTFRGTTTTVKNSSEEIQRYLIGLSENNFAGAMAQRMSTLDGALSNLEDSWNQLFLNISQQGAGDAIAAAVRLANDALGSLNTSLASGQIEGYLGAIAGKFEGYFGDIASGWADLSSGMSSEFGNEMQFIADLATGSVDWILDAFGDMPENIRAMLQILVVEFASGFDRLASHATEFKEKVAAIFTDDTIDAAAKRGEERIKAIDQVREDSIQSIMNERQAALSSFDDQIQKADEARQKFEAANAAKTGDQLAGFAGPAPAREISTTEAETSKPEKFDPATDPEVTATQQRINYLRSLKDMDAASSLQSEELAHMNRLDMLRKRFEAGELPSLESYNRLKESAQQKHENNVAELVLSGATKLAELDSTRRNALGGVIVERDAVLAGYDEQIRKAEEARLAFEGANAARTGTPMPALADPAATGGQVDPMTGQVAAPEAWAPDADPEVLATQQRIAYLRTLKDAEVATDLESEQLAHLSKMEMLRQRFEDGEIPTLEAYNRLKESVQARHEENVTNITQQGAAQRAAFMKKSFTEQASQTFSTLTSITAGVASHNKGMFELNKAAGIGSAIINTYKGVSESLAAYPMPTAAVMAAGHLAAGLAQVSAIKSQTFGNTSASTGAVGGMPITNAPSNIALPQVATQPTQPQAPQQPEIRINVSIDDDANFSGRYVRRLIEEIERQANLDRRAA